MFATPLFVLREVDFFAVDLREVDFFAVDLREVVFLFFVGLRVPPFIEDDIFFNPSFAFWSILL